MVGSGEVLYDAHHHPEIPEGWIYRVLLGIAALMRACGAVLAIKTSGILLSLPMLPLAFHLYMPRRMAEGLLWAIPEVLMGLLISWLLMRFGHKSTLGELGLRFNRRQAAEMILGVAGGMAALGMVVAIPMLAGEWEWAPAETRIRGPWGASILLGLLALATFSEELALRGYAFQTLVYPLHLLGGVVVTSGVFAALHLRNPNADEYSTANTFLAGCIFGMLVAWRRSLWAATGAHFGWNLATLLSGLNLSGENFSFAPYTIAWKLDRKWTGGSYGPEGSLPCAVVLALILFVLIWLYHRQPRQQGLAG
jgi:membrane protease YdiL (CAAX protease family)